MNLDVRQNFNWIIEKFIHLPIRTRLSLPLFIILFITNIFVFHYIEGHSWVTSIYFVVILLTTIGFGDIVPTSDITRILVILLVLSGFLTFAFAAEDIFENIIQQGASSRGGIPSKPLEKDGHVIVGGYGSKGRRVASLLRERGFEVIVLDVYPETAQVAIAAGFRAIIADVSKIDVLEKLSLDRSRGLFLLLNDDYATIHAAIHARSISHSIIIYAELLNTESDEVARYAGIDNPILLSTALSRKIREILRDDFWFVPYPARTLVTQRASVGYIRSKSLNQVFEDFKTSYLLGTTNVSLNSFEIVGRPSGFDINGAQDRYEYLFVVERDELNSKYLHGNNLLSDKGRNILIAGYNEVVRDVLNKLKLTNKSLTVLWSTQEEYELAMEDGHFLVKWEVSKCARIVSELVKEGDIILSFFEDVTDALILGLSLKRQSLNQNFIQTVLYEREVKPYVRAGASFVVSSQFVVADLMLREFFNDIHRPPSIIHGDTHIFEQYMTEDNIKYWKKFIRGLGNDKFVLKIQSNNYGITPLRLNKLNVGDRILLVLQNIHPINPR